MLRDLGMGSGQFGISFIFIYFSKERGVFQNKCGKK